MGNILSNAYMQMAGQAWSPVGCDMLVHQKQHILYVIFFSLLPTFPGSNFSWFRPISNCQVGLCCAASWSWNHMPYGLNCLYRCREHPIDRVGVIGNYQVPTNHHIIAQSKVTGISNVLRFTPFLSKWWRTSNFFTRWKIRLVSFI